MNLGEYCQEQNDQNIITFNEMIIQLIATTKFYSLLIHIVRAEFYC